ncbi:MAG: DUF362 domain-containing protein [Spirochaetales bacterium]|nr:DUF362 domain-containing protein [Spirochaetales bacterium]
MGKVSIVKIDESIKDTLHKALSLIGGIGLFVQKEDRVLLKPNLNDVDCITNINLVDALIQYLFDYEMKDIVIAESTFGNKYITEEYFKKSGYYEISEKFGIPLINLNKSESIEMRVKNPLVLEKIKVAKEVGEAIKIINIPVMKVHYATGVTLGLKNLKGFLPPDEKKHFHEAGLDKSIADLNTIIHPDLTIIDGMYCMERMGPKGGDVFYLGLLIAGGNNAETDYVAGQIMGYDLPEIKHLRYYVSSAGIDVTGISVCGEKIEQVMRPFKKVDIKKMIPANIIIYNTNACSACMNALLISFSFVKKEIKQKTAIYLGNNTMIQDSDVTIAFGNCCSGIDAQIRIKGCPPYPLLLGEKLK